MIDYYNIPPYIFLRTITRSILLRRLSRRFWGNVTKCIKQIYKFINEKHAVFQFQVFAIPSDCVDPILMSNRKIGLDNIASSKTTGNKTAVGNTFGCEPKHFNMNNCLSKCEHTRSYSKEVYIYCLSETVRKVSM